jgi:glycosyltransferase involved in cell wall biosynthesis
VKVLNVNHLLDPEVGGGTAERTFQLSRFMAKAGVRCTILTLDIGSPYDRMDALEGTRVVALPCVNQRYFLPLVSLGAINRLVATADVVHLSGHWTVLNALVHRACRRQGKPHVFCPAGALKTYGRSILLKRFYDKLIGRGLARSAAAGVAITEAERADFAAYGVADDRIQVIPNGIDPQQYMLPDPADWERDFRRRHDLGNAPYILFLGRLNDIKGPDLLLDAFAQVADRYPDMHLFFAGPDNGMLPQLKATAAARSLAHRVHFSGYLGGVNKTAALSAASLLAIPSRHEAMSLVVLEAGIRGTPVLFTDACGIDNIARSGAGTMVPVSAQGLAAGLTSMLSDGAALRASGQRLAALIREEYTWQTQAERHIALYQRILASDAT